MKVAVRSVFQSKVIRILERSLYQLPQDFPARLATLQAEHFLVAEPQPPQLPGIGTGTELATEPIQRTKNVTTSTWLAVGL